MNQPRTIDDAGWCARAVQHPSPNFDARPDGVDISLIVIHNISLPPNQFGGEWITDLFLNRLDPQAHPYFETIHTFEVSAHFLIRRNGEIVQFVSCDARAWHAGQSSFRGQPNCNDYSIGIELEGLEGDRFEPARYAALARLCRALARRYPIDAIVGHEHVAPGRKHDPGPGFDWRHLRTLLRWPARRFADGVLG